MYLTTYYVYVGMDVYVVCEQYAKYSEIGGRKRCLREKEQNLESWRRRYLKLLFYLRPFAAS